MSLNKFDKLDRFDLIVDPETSFDAEEKVSTRRFPPYFGLSSKFCRSFQDYL